MASIGLDDAAVRGRQLVAIASELTAWLQMLARPEHIPLISLGRCCQGAVWMFQPWRSRGGRRRTGRYVLVLSGLSVLL